MRVECLSCGCVADRILKPDDQRTPADILARGRCGKCRITMKWGDVRISFDGGAWIQAKPPRPREPITARPHVHQAPDPIPEDVNPDLPPTRKPNWPPWNPVSALLPERPPARPLVLDPPHLPPPRSSDVGIAFDLRNWREYLTGAAYLAAGALALAVLLPLLRMTLIVYGVALDAG